MVENSATLAIPGPEYWAGTAAHFYVNPPGVSADEGCIWGSVDKPHGNWSPYVLGGNAVEGGETFIKLGWNPIYLEPATPFRDVKPSFGVEIICEGDGCNGLPCAIDPSQHGVNELVGGGGSSGAGGAVSCVVTVPSGGSAKYVITEFGGSGGGSSPTATSPIDFVFKQRAASTQHLINRRDANFNPDPSHDYFKHKLFYLVINLNSNPNTDVNFYVVVFIFVVIFLFVDHFLGGGDYLVRLPCFSTHIHEQSGRHALSRTSGFYPTQICLQAECVRGQQYCDHDSPQ
ncbi:MAG: hypothetical protein Q9194_004888 [Teloschistes cf. exilis]